MRHILSLIFFLTPLLSINSQNTVGTILNTDQALNGYTLFAPLISTETYLINNCGEIVNQWSSSYTPAASVYLLENGDLLRTCKIPNNDINFDGIGGRIEKYDWDNNLIWSYEYTSSTYSLHHDIYPLPSGNILMLAVTVVNENDAIQMGRDPSTISEGKIYNEQIIEVEPVGTNSGNIVWEWNITDHLIQDFDSTKDNFGIVSDNPQLLNFNYIGISENEARWLHMNSLQYNEDLDQIIISSRMLSELYIIDHSTSTAEAAGHSGGIYGKGGDFLYRWGNPIAYNQGTESDQQLFQQHKPHWIPDNLIDGGKIMIFNNGYSRSPSYSQLFIIDPPMDSPGVYSYTADTAYGPSSPDYIYQDPVDPINFYSPIVSSGQRLSNGNILICEGVSGYFFEIDANDTIVWEYISPVTSSGILSQGDNSDAPEVNNIVFRAEKFAPDYPAFTGRDLTPGVPVELDPIPGNCELVSVAEEPVYKASVFPNPVKDFLSVNSERPLQKIEIYSFMGKLIKSDAENNRINLVELSDGVYYVKIFFSKGFVTKKIIKMSH